jgi:pSer/pThr/pTyr-binding forkhead associated (FHA) protein
MSSQQLAPVAVLRAKTHSSTTRLRDAPTQHFDAVRCLSSRETRKALDGEAIPHGSYLLAPGTSRALLIPLDGPMTHLGRGLNADLHLDDASVSRRHAIILRTDEGHRILDDRSLNGTWVNGREIQEAELRDGDVITLGRVELTYREV